MKKLCLLSLVLLSSFASAQNSRSDGVVQSRNGFPAPSASIAVCSPVAITAASESVSTVTTTSTLNPAQGSTVQIVGMTPAAYNGSYTVLTTSGTNFTYTNPTQGLGAGTVFGTALVVSTTPCSPLASLCASFTDTTCTSPNPVTADGLGNYSFYVKPGRYTAQFYGTGLTARLQPDQVLACDPSASCTLTGPITITGAMTSCIVNGMYVAGSSCYATIAAAVTAAAAAPGGPATTLIPGTYTGTDSYYADTNSVLDLRHGSIAIGHYIGASYPSCQDSGCATIFPWGGDIVMDVEGPGDRIFGQNIRNPGAGQVNDTATNLIIGSNSNVAVTNQTGVALATCGAGICFLIVGRGTANEELVTTYTINSATSITLTCAKTHTAPVSIEQVDATRVDVSRFFQWRSFAPPVSPGFTANMNFVDVNGSTLYELPGAVNNAWPNNALNIGAMPISAWNGPRNTAGALSVNFRNSNASQAVNFNRSTDNQTQVAITDTQLATSNGFNIAEGASTHSMAAGGQYLNTEGGNPGTQAGADVLGASSASHCYMGSFNADGPFCLTRTVASGTAAMTTAGIATGACGTTVTVAATNVATTDVINFAHNAAPTNGNGGNLILNAWPTSGNVNFNYCNPSAGTVTPTAMTLNWTVTR